MSEPHAASRPADGIRSFWPLGALEKVLLATWLGYSVIAVLLWDRLVDPWPTLQLNLSILGGVIGVTLVTHRQRPMLVDFGRACITLLTCFGSYEFSRVVLQALPTRSYELEMLRLDQMIFGGNPSVWMERIYTPVLTEYFQLIYVAYFPILFMVGLSVLWARQHRIFHDFAVALMLGVVFNHILYVLVPVRSPFLIADLEPFREWITYSGQLVGLKYAAGMRAHLLDATTMRYDCFPSGHTMHTLIAVYFAYKGGYRPVAWLVTFLAASIVASTLYLRYHYGIDLILGALFAGVFCYIGPKARAWLDGERRAPSRQRRQAPRPSEEPRTAGI